MQNIEFGHFYLNNFNHQEFQIALNIKNNIVQENKEQYNSLILIDETHLDAQIDISLSDYLKPHADIIIFERKLKPACDELLSLVPTHHLSRSNNKLLFDKSILIRSENGYSCAFFAATFYLIQLGIIKIPQHAIFYQEKELVSDKIMTVLPSGYQKTETKVRQIIDAIHPDIKDQQTYIYY